MFLKGSTFLCIHSTGKIHHGKVEFHLKRHAFSRFGGDVWIDCSVCAAASQKAPERHLWRSGEPHNATSNRCPHSGRQWCRHVVRPHLRPNRPLWQIVWLSLSAELATLLKSLLYSSVSGWNIYPFMLLGGAAWSVARLIRIRKHWTTIRPPMFAHTSVSDTKCNPVLLRREKKHHESVEIFIIHRLSSSLFPRCFFHPCPPNTEATKSTNF